MPNITRIKQFLALAILLLPASGWAGGYDWPQGCYAREYSDTHLVSQPNQVVAAIWLNFYHQQGNDFAALSVVTSEQGHAAKSGLGNQFFDQFLICSDPGRSGSDRAVCAVECDGGSFWIKAFDGKVLDIRTQYLMAGDTEGCGGAINLAEKPGQPVTYRLYRVDDAQCETN